MQEIKRFDKAEQLFLFLIYKQQGYIIGEKSKLRSYSIYSSIRKSKARNTVVAKSDMIEYLFVTKF